MLAAFTLVVALPMTDQVGFLLVAIFAGLIWRTRVRSTA